MIKSLLQQRQKSLRSGVVCIILVGGKAEKLLIMILIKELTQMELSRLANTGVRFISDLENGKPDVSLSKLLSVVYALGLELRIVNKWSD